MRLISAVMGGRTFKGREAESKKLLTWGFRFFETVNPLKVGKEFASEPVWFGDSDRASLGVDKDVYLTIPRGRMKDLKASYFNGFVVVNFFFNKDRQHQVVKAKCCLFKHSAQRRRFAQATRALD